MKKSDCAKMCPNKTKHEAEICFELFKCNYKCSVCGLSANDKSHDENGMCNGKVCGSEE